MPELCRCFEIPHRPPSEVPADLDPADLHEEADFSGLTGNHGERFDPGRAAAGAVRGGRRVPHTGSQTAAVPPGFIVRLRSLRSLRRTLRVKPRRSVSAGSLRQPGYSLASRGSAR